LFSFRLSPKINSRRHCELFVGPKRAGYVSTTIKDTIDGNDFGIAGERGTSRDDLRPGLRIVGYQRRATIAFHVDDKCQAMGSMRLMNAIARTGPDRSAM
jgi:hypothetical protein